MCNQIKAISYPNVSSCISFNNRPDVVELSEMFASILDMSLTVEGGGEWVEKITCLNHDRLYARAIISDDWLSEMFTSIPDMSLSGLLMDEWLIDG